MVPLYQYTDSDLNQGQLNKQDSCGILLTLGLTVITVIIRVIMVDRLHTRYQVGQASIN